MGTRCPEEATLALSANVVSFHFLLSVFGTFPGAPGTTPRLRQGGPAPGAPLLEVLHLSPQDWSRPSTFLIWAHPSFYSPQLVEWGTVDASCKLDNNMIIIASIAKYRFIFRGGFHNVSQPARLLASIGEVGKSRLMNDPRPALCQLPWSQPWRTWNRSFRTRKNRFVPGLTWQAVNQ